MEEIKNIIGQSHNIYIALSEDNKEGVVCALALFYTLKELNKNVNLTLDAIPEELRFLIPSLNYISYPKNFIISVPKNKAEVSQVSYEADNENLNIKLNITSGNIKKDDISFYFTEPSVDLLITIGLKNINEIKLPHLLEKTIILNANTINIDNQIENTRFGKINLITPGVSLSELIFDMIKSIDSNIIKKEGASSLLAGVIINSDNFKNQNTSPKILETAADLLKKGADHQAIITNLYK